MLGPRRKTTVRLYDEQGNCEEREITMVLTVGTARKMKSETGRDIMQFSASNMDTDALVEMLYYTALQGGSDLKLEEIDMMAYGELMDKGWIINEMLDEFMPDRTGAKNRPLKGKK